MKSKRGIQWLITLMTLSLLGVIGIQAYWIANSYIIKEEKFEQQVGEALSGVSRRLETLENLNFLNEKLQMESFTSPGMFGYDTIFKSSESYSISLGISGDTLYMINKEGKIHTSSANADSDSSVRLSGYEGVFHLYNRAKSLDRTFRKMLQQQMRRGQNINHRINARDLDSLLYLELLSRGIDVPFEFAVAEKGNIVMKSEDWQPYAEQHRARLFPNDFYENRLVMLSFPSKANYLFRSMWFTLLLSIGFTMAMIYTFWRTLIYSMRQKRISEIKTDFINNMTHEFKTPIATINLAIDAMSNSKVISDPEKIKHYSKVIKQENQRMNLQVESVLRMAPMDKKELELNFEKIVMQDLLNECVDHIKLQLEARSGKLQKFFNDGGRELMVDRNHMANAIINILDNAIKYSPGPPEIKMVTELTDEQFIIIISDKGVGMNKEEQKRIFDRFFRVAAGDIHNIKGHGLGLSYVQGIIEAHQGMVEVESEKSRGSKFYIYMPLNNKHDRQKGNIIGGR